MELLFNCIKKKKATTHRFVALILMDFKYRLELFAHINLKCRGYCPIAANQLKGFMYATVNSQKFF